MSQELLISLFSAAASWMLTLTILWNATRNEMRNTRLAVKLFIDGMGKAAAEVLHSPEDHLGLDRYLDKYIDGHFDMSDNDWAEFRKICTRLQSDKSMSDAERIAAGTILAAFSVQVANHKLQRIPLEMLNRIEKL